MGTKKLDGPGQVRMATLDEAMALQQRLHGLVEQYALAVQRSQPASHLMMNLRRQMPVLAGKLKGQFGSIADLVTTVNMQMTRGSAEKVRVRQMREGMAAVKTQLEIAVTQTLEKYEIKEQPKPRRSESV